MSAMGKVAVILVVSVLLVIILGAIVLTTLLSVLQPTFSFSGGAAPVGAVYGGNNAATLAAKQMATHLNSDCLKLHPHPDCAGDASYDSGFPQNILHWGFNFCGSGCITWANNHFQCVSFVLGAYALFHPLDWTGNGSDFYGLYATPDALSNGYHEQLPSRGQMPISPGDVMTWSSAAHPDGHVSIVLGWLHPTAGQTGKITFAQANGEAPVQTLPILPGGQIDTNDGYWNGFVVTSYIHPAWLPIVPGAITNQSPAPANALPPGLTMSTPYVAEAWTDAVEVGIPPVLFVRQINQESGFNPNASSPAGAIGIAQFMPATAAALEFDPHDPDASLPMAALSLSEKQVSFHGDYAKALAANNAGDGKVQSAISRCGQRWLSCLPQETRQYVAAILR